MPDKVRENYLRRQAQRLGLDFQKSRGRKWAINDQLEYKIIDQNRSIVLVGECFDASIDQVAQALDDYERRLRN